MQPVEIIKMVDKEAAWALLEEQPWSARKKAQTRYHWKQRNDPSSIDKCLAKGRRYKDAADAVTVTSPTSEEWWTWLANFEMDYDDPADLMTFHDCWECRLENKDKDEAWFLALFPIIGMAGREEEGHESLQDLGVVPGMTGLHLLCGLVERGTQCSDKVDDLVTTLFHAMTEEGVLLRDDSGSTAFHYACREGRMHYARLFLERFGARVVVDSFDNQKTTGFMMACKTGSLPMAQLLYNRGAAIDARDKDGKTALDYARDAGWMDIVEFF